MKLFFYYNSFGFSNCYILGSDNAPPGQKNTAIIVDPGSIENKMIKTVEDNNFDLQAVLVTHEHLPHMRGLRTLKKIYNIEVIAVNQYILNHKTTMVKDGDILIIGGFTIDVISIPGHSSDSAVYKIGNLLFTGDVLTAGLVGSTASAYGAATQMNKLRSRLVSLPGNYIVLPGHGPPSTMEAERRFNIDIYNYDKNRAKRPAFKVDL